MRPSPRRRPGSPDRPPVEGRTPRSALDLFISPRTIERHRHKVFAALDVNSRNKQRGATQRGAPDRTGPHSDARASAPLDRRTTSSTMVASRAADESTYWWTPERGQARGWAPTAAWETAAAPMFTRMSIAARISASRAGNPGRAKLLVGPVVVGPLLGSAVVASAGRRIHRGEQAEREGRRHHGGDPGASTMSSWRGGRSSTVGRHRFALSVVAGPVRCGSSVGCCRSSRCRAGPGCRWPCRSRRRRGRGRTGRRRWIRRS